MPVGVSGRHTLSRALPVAGWYSPVLVGRGPLWVGRGAPVLGSTGLLVLGSTVLIGLPVFGALVTEPVGASSLLPSPPPMGMFSFGWAVGACGSSSGREVIPTWPGVSSPVSAGVVLPK